MPFIYVAASKGLADWGASVGLTKHIYKVGVAEDSAEAAIGALNLEGHAGQRDWKLLKKQPAEDLSEAEALERLARKERLVDPTLYPGIRGAGGIFKVKPTNVENHLIVQQSLGTGELKPPKIRPPEIAAYLITNAKR
jgi:hypothetical protein